ncbi:MAG: DUF1800 domain-containing protein [Pirellulales bacterium]|nr:DUF1800 domain-containing protein [Pirellulales bacterium]
MTIRDHWKPYTPSSDQPWNRKRVEHLHQRLGFAATPAEIDRDLRAGFANSVDRMLSLPHPSLDKDPPLVPEAAKLARRAIDGNHIGWLKAAWVMQMWHSPTPLTEQLCLMWHNHFATSFLKVRDCHAMWQQNQRFRKYGRGRYADLLAAMLTDRAMLLWLDGHTNRIGHPNENLARELLELFTLGVGNYGEHDVQQVARALTGWRIDNLGVRFEKQQHDGDVKTILGSTAHHNVQSLVELLVQHPATADRLAWRLCDHFLGSGVPTQAIEQLADHLRANDLTIQSAVETLVRSARFFADHELLHRVRSPVSFVVGGVRSLELHQPAADTVAVSPEWAASWMASMGQDLFQPPGVAGWQGGTVWLGTAAMIQRIAFAKALGERHPTRQKALHHQTHRLAGAHVD